MTRTRCCDVLLRCGGARRSCHLNYRTIYSINPHINLSQLTEHGPLKVIISFPRNVGLTSLLIYRNVTISTYEVIGRRTNRVLSRKRVVLLNYAYVLSSVTSPDMRGHWTDLWGWGRESENLGFKKGGLLATFRITREGPAQVTGSLAMP